MQKLLIFSMLFFGILLSSCSDTITDDNNVNENKLNLTADETELVKSSQTFGIKLFQEIDRTDERENIFISPLSVSMAFGMLLNGADNATYDSIRNVLGFENLTNEEINKAYKHLIGLLESIDEQVLFEIANSIWYHNSFSVETTFLNTNIEYFNAEISALNFADPASLDIINGWVSEKTHEKIKTIIDEISSDEIMYLINAIYFKGTWKYEFDKDNTRDDSFFFPNGGNGFYKMMTMQARLNYYEDDDLQIVELPYGNEHYSMLVFLPSKVDGLDDFIQSLDENQWQSYINQLEPDSVVVELPKFKVEYKLQMNDVLINMGMHNAFLPGLADFSRINPTAELAISRVIHKTFVQVDEEGTEAAAVTAIGIYATSIENDENNVRYFYANHPFLYAIREKDSGAILFMGRMDRPNWTE